VITHRFFNPRDFQPDFYRMNSVLLPQALFMCCINDDLVEALYDPHISGLDVAWDNCRAGIELRVVGYSHKLPELAATVSKAMKTYTPSLSAFQRQKNAMQRRQRNVAKSDARGLAEYEGERALMSNKHHYSEYLAVLDSVTLEDLQAWQRTAFRRSFVEILVHGNFDEAEVSVWGRQVAETLTSLCDAGADAIALRDEYPRTTLVNLPSGLEWQLCVDHPNHAETNSAVIALLFVDSDSARVIALVKLLGMVLSEPVFSQLRTKEQLGYIVSTAGVSMLSACWLQLSVQSHTASAQWVDSRIDGFLAGFRGVLVSKSDTEIQEKIANLAVRWMVVLVALRVVMVLICRCGF
jgi:insulysin